MNLIGNNILESISNEIKQYSITNKGKVPAYIILHEADSVRLLNAMNKAKLIPDNTEPKKLNYAGLRVIRTKDIPEGYFDIVGS